MASPTKKTQLKRKRRDSRRGAKRKADLRSKGSTPTQAKLFGDKE